MNKPLSQTEINTILRHHPELAGRHGHSAGDGERMIHSPFRDEKNPSCSINYDSGLVYDHGGDFSGNLLQAAQRLGGDASIGAVRARLNLISDDFGSGQKKSRMPSTNQNWGAGATPEMPADLPPVQDLDQIDDDGNSMPVEAVLLPVMADHHPEALDGITPERFEPVGYGYYARIDSDGADVGGKRILAPPKRPSWAVRGDDGELMPGSPAKPRPLYGTPTLLAERLPVAFVEGERCALLLNRLTGWPAVTGGSATDWQQCDLSPLQGRIVVVWPDSDRTGKKMLKVIDALHKLGSEVWLAPLVGGELLTSGGLDVADLALEAGGGEKYAPADAAAAARAVRQHLAMSEKQLHGEELARHQEQVARQKSAMKDEARRERKLQKIDERRERVAEGREIARQMHESEIAGVNAEGTMIDNANFAVVGIDRDDSKIVVLNRRRGDETAIPVSHGSGRLLAPLGSLNFFVAITGSNTWTVSESNGRPKKIKHKLGGDLGDKIIDEWNDHCSANRLFVDRSVRFGTGAVPMPDGKIVYNLNDGVVEAGAEKARDYQPDDLRVMIPTKNPLSKVYSSKAADSFDPKLMLEVLECVKKWGFTSGEYAAEFLIGSMLFSVFASSAVVSWKPGYSLIGEAGSGKGRLVFSHLMPLLCGLCNRKDEFTKASLYGRSAANRVVTFCNEVNSETQREQWSNEAYDKYVLHASDEGRREVMKNNADEGERVTVVGSPTFSMRNTMNDSVALNTKRRVNYEHLQDTEVFEDDDLCDRLDEQVAEIGNTLASRLIRGSIDRSLKNRVQHLIRNYNSERNSSQPEFKKKVLIQVVPQCVAAEIAFGWDEKKTIDMISHRGQVVLMQIDVEAKLTWKAAADAIALSKHTVSGIGYTNAQLCRIALGFGRIHNRVSAGNSKPEAVGSMVSAAEIDAMHDAVDSASVAATILSSVGLVAVRVKRRPALAVDLENPALKSQLRLLSNSPNGIKAALRQAPNDMVSIQHSVRIKLDNGESRVVKRTVLLPELMKTYQAGEGTDEDGEADAGKFDNDDPEWSA